MLECQLQSDGHWLLCDLLKLQFGCVCDMSGCLLDMQRASCKMLHAMCVMLCASFGLVHHSARSIFNAVPTNHMAMCVHSTCLMCDFKDVLHSLVHMSVHSCIHSFTHSSFMNAFFPGVGYIQLGCTCADRGF